MLIQTNSRYYLFKDSLSTAWYIPFLERGVDHCKVGLEQGGWKLGSYSLSETTYSNFTFVQFSCYQGKMKSVNNVEEQGS